MQVCSCLYCTLSYGATLVATPSTGVRKLVSVFSGAFQWHAGSSIVQAVSCLCGASQLYAGFGIVQAYFLLVPCFRRYAGISMVQVCVLLVLYRVLWCHSSGHPVHRCAEAIVCFPWRLPVACRYQYCAGVSCLC